MVATTSTTNLAAAPVFPQLPFDNLAHYILRQEVKRLACGYIHNYRHFHGMASQMVRWLDLNAFKLFV